MTFTRRSPSTGWLAELLEKLKPAWPKVEEAPDRVGADSEGVNPITKAPAPTPLEVKLGGAAGFDPNPVAEDVGWPTVVTALASDWFPAAVVAGEKPDGVAAPVPGGLVNSPFANKFFAILEPPELETKCKKNSFN